jgi:H+-transporting ATPase
VLTYPGLSAVVSAITVSRKIFTRMKNFVVYRIACTLQLLFFFLIGCLSYNPKDYCADTGFFYLPVSALVTIVILNDGTIISVAFDNVDSSLAPEEWNMVVLSIVSSVVGLVALISSVVLLGWGMQCSGNHMQHLYASDPANHAYCNNHDTNFLTRTGMDDTFGLSGLDYDRVRTMIYLKVALSDYISLFNCRCQGWFFSRRPSWHVMVAAIFSTVISSLLAHWWPFGSDMTGIPMGVVGFVWLYTLCWGLIQDACKVFTYWALKKMNYIKAMEAINEKDFSERMEAGRAESRRLAEIRAKEDLKVLEYGEVSLEGKC